VKHGGVEQLHRDRSAKLRERPLRRIAVAADAARRGRDSQRVEDVLGRGLVPRAFADPHVRA